MSCVIITPADVSHVQFLSIILQESRTDEEPLPVSAEPEVARRIGRSSLGFANFYYPDPTSLPDICTTCVAGSCQVNTPCLVCFTQEHVWHLVDRRQGVVAAD